MAKRQFRVNPSEDRRCPLPSVVTCAFQTDFAHLSNLKPALYQDDPLDSNEDEICRGESRLFARFKGPIRPPAPPPSAPPETEDPNVRLLVPGHPDVDHPLPGYLDLPNRLRWWINPENN